MKVKFVKNIVIPSETTLGPYSLGDTFDVTKTEEIDNKFGRVYMTDIPGLSFFEDELEFQKCIKL